MVNNKIAMITMSLNKSFLLFVRPRPVHLNDTIVRDAYVDIK